LSITDRLSVPDAEKRVLLPDANVKEPAEAMAVKPRTMVIESIKLNIFIFFITSLQI